jgi:protein SMG5
LQIAQFCNHIATNYADCDATTTTSAANEIVTVLTGDHLREKKNSNFSYTGLLESIPVKYDQIVSFYSNYKKK